MKLIYTADVYYRLSKEDINRGDESCSIINQRMNSIWFAQYKAEYEVLSSCISFLPDAEDILRRQGNGLVCKIQNSLFPHTAVSLAHPPSCAWPALLWGLSGFSAMEAFPMNKKKPAQTRFIL